LICPCRDRAAWRSAHTAPDASRDGWLVTLPAHHPHAILRECVLLAERALGQHLSALELPAIFAVNPAPSAADLHDVVKAALALEIPLELSEDGDTSATELAQCFSQTDRQRPLQQQFARHVEPRAAVERSRSPQRGRCNHGTGAMVQPDPALRRHLQSTAAADPAAARQRQAQHPR
jgi:hypothetical protein